MTTPNDQNMTDKNAAARADEPASAGSRQSARRRLAILIPAALAVGLAVAIYTGIRSRNEAEANLANVTEQAAKPTVDVVHPTPGAPDQEVVLPGNVQAFTDTPIFARTSGYLKRWYFDIGAHVKQGDLLAEIESPEADQQLQQARADLVTAQANLALAKVTWKREQALYQNQWASGQMRDNAYGAYSADQAIVQSQQADVARLEQLQSYEKVTAPFDGVITARNTDVGALITADTNTTTQELFHLAASNKLRVFVTIPEVYVPGARPGVQATLKVDEYPDQSFRGTLVRTASAIDATSRTLLAEIDVDNPTGQLLPGAYGFVHLAIPAAAHSVTVPSSALLFRAEGLQVALVRNGHAALVPVNIGRDYGDKVEIISGLLPTDDLIVSPSDSLITGTAVSVAAAKSK
jgi:RND family efflux transporter MFP subunit